MTRKPEIALGPYRLVRSHRSSYLRIYSIQSATTDTRLALLLRIEAPGLDIPEEWQARCSHPGCSASRTYPTRDQALRWVGYHRITKHSQSVMEEVA